MPDINGIPYVASGDLVSAYPTVSQDLAQEVSDQLATKLDAADQKIIQVVRATDASQRSTTSTSFTDVNLSVTITPTKATSSVYLMAFVFVQQNRTTGTDSYGVLQITDNSNNAISGAEATGIGEENYSFSGTTRFRNAASLLAVSTPATTSATTYKLRFRSEVATTSTIIRGNASTSQLIAIEVGA